MPRRPLRLTRELERVPHPLSAAAIESTDLPLRHYGRYLSRQFRRLTLASRSRAGNNGPRNHPHSDELSLLNHAARKVNRYCRLTLLRTRRRAARARTSARPFGLAPECAVGLRSTASHDVQPHSSASYQTHPGTPSDSRLNRLLRRFIITQRRNAPPRPSTTQTRGRRGRAAPRIRQTFSHSNREGFHSARSEFYRTRRVPKRKSPSEITFYDLGVPNQSCDHCGAVVWLQERTNKRNTRSRPRYGVCCNGGSVQLPLLREPPPYLKYLMESSDRTAVIFRQSMRPYNAIFAFTSIGARVDNSMNDGRGPYVFRLNGLNYHRIGSLLPLHDEQPRFAQLYFHDSGDEASNRIRALTGRNETDDLEESVVTQLIAMLATHNPLAQAFKSARERFAASDLADVRLRLIGTRNRDARQHNLPSASEVAAIIVGNEPNRGHTRDIVIENRALGFQRISDVHPSFMAMQYPLLFPYGEDGYMPGILKRYASGDTGDDKTISYRAFLTFRLHFRPNEWYVLMRAGRLFQQFIVDSVMILEAQRLGWFSRNQGTLRSEVYQQMVDSIVAGDTDAAAIGKRIILPSSFTGGPRYMIQSYQDALAICRWAGPPDYFITFTCNPKWPEIPLYASLMDHVKPEDMSIAIARVFKLKVERLMQVLQDEQIFGQVIAATHVIEFQKRGLPHVHILLFMHPSDKPKIPADIDKVISAEIPDKEADPELYQIVSDCMIHGPCGPSCLCDGRCSRKFPKKNAEETTIDEHGGATYKRSRDSHVIVKNGVSVDNTWVVPYNARLLKEFRAHINVEFVNRGRLVKYLFKYMSKGSDRSNAAVEENLLDGSNIRTVNEIAVYADCRYMSAPEAAYRAMGFDLQYRKPSVQRLAFHLEDEQNVLFHDDDDLYDIVHNPTVKQTMFTEWMRTNELYPDARNLTYVEFPMEWVWYATERVWKRRERGFQIGRIYYAHPLSGERFYMRMLLTIQRGSRTFTELKTVRDEEHADCKAACRALGLLEDDNEWKNAIIEAAASATSQQLRRLFVTLIQFSEVSDPLKLWTDHWELLSDDIVRREMPRSGSASSTLTTEDLKNMVLIELEKLMNQNNRSLREIPSLPFPNIDEGERIVNRLLSEEQHYNPVQLSHQYEQMFSSLNSDQLQAFSAIVESVLNGCGKAFFIHGGGGTGKTYLWNTVIAYLRSVGKIVLPVASSGIAALLFPGGRTAHSRFKIPMNTDDTTCCNIKKGSHLAELLRKADLIIWDEAPMAHRHDFETVDRSLRDLLTYDGVDARNKLFGGKTFALGGDFRQILPVVVKGRREAIVGASINTSYIWDSCKVFHLQQNMRLSADSSSPHGDHLGMSYRDWILAVGEGKIKGFSASADVEPNWIDMPSDIIVPSTTDNIAAIVSSIYSALQHSLGDVSYFRERCILAPTNDVVDSINEVVIDLFPGQIREYLSADSISPDSEHIAGQDLMYPPEVLHQMTMSGIPNHVLKLKVGVPIMLLRNIDQSRGMCNGTRLIVTKIEDHFLQAEIITGNNIGSREMIPRIVMTSAKTNRWHVALRRVQYPIRVCFAMTINKSQGQTVSNVGVYLPKPVFTHGQLYVALSRTTTRSGMRVLVENCDPQFQNKTQNIVFTEVFSNL